MKNKLKCLLRKERIAIEEYRKLLLKKFPRRIKRIILFGSKARGSSNRTSDIDLLIVVTRNGKHIREEIAWLTHEPISRFKVLLSPIIVEEKELIKVWSPFLEHVRKEGITLWKEKSKKSM